MQGVRNRTISEIDGRPANDPAFRIHTKARATIAIDPEFTFVLVDLKFADACDRPFTHQDRHARCRYVQKLAQLRSVYYKCAVADLDIRCGRLWSSGSRQLATIKIPLAETP